MPKLERAPGSRLTSLPGLPAPHPEKVAQHAFRRVAGGVLITGEAGHAWLDEAQYRRYLEGALSPDAEPGKTLAAKGFLRDRLDFNDLARRSVSRQLLDWPGPNVHTIVLTQRCNMKCLYCHASVVDPSVPGKDMTVETARAVVDLAFSSANPTLMLEFQGGEPLLNWPVLQFVVRYAKKKNEVHKKALHFGLISNFSLMDEARLDWLIGEGVSFCTSLDGPAWLHDKNRIHLGGSGHELVIRWLKRIQERRRQGAKVDAPNAICTVTRHSLGAHKEIVDQLVELGIERVQLGPLDPIGFANKSWDKIGYASAEFLDFYARTLDYLIERNRQGVKAYEKMALILLLRVLEGEHWRFPNADGICRLAYNHDGGIYLSEEGRLLANAGDPFFLIGRAGTSSLQDLLDHPTVRTAALAASPLSQPQCSQCAYSPACTVLPVFNHQTQGSVWGRMTENAWCEKMMGVFDLLFARLREPEAKKVLESWLEYKSR